MSKGSTSESQLQETIMEERHAISSLRVYSPGLRVS